MSSSSSSSSTDNCFTPEDYRTKVLCPAGLTMFDFKEKSPPAIYQLKSTLLRQRVTVPQLLDDTINDMVSEGNVKRPAYSQKLDDICKDEKERLLYKKAFEIVLSASDRPETPGDWLFSCHCHIMLFTVEDLSTHLRVELGGLWDSVNIEVPEQDKGGENKDVITIFSNKRVLEISFLVLPIYDDGSEISKSCFSQSFISSIEWEHDVELFSPPVADACIPMIVGASKGEQSSFFEVENDLAVSIIKMLVRLQSIGATDIPVLGIAMAGPFWQIYLAFVGTMDNFDGQRFFMQPIWSGAVTNLQDTVEACLILKSYALWMISIGKDAILKCLKNLKKRKSRRSGKPELTRSRLTSRFLHF